MALPPLSHAEPGPVPDRDRAAPVRYEAETATISQGAAESNHTGYSGSGFVNYANTTGGYVEFTVNSPAAGPATLVLGYANAASADRPLNLSVNGGAPASLAFAPTGGWANWATVTTRVTLKAGANTVRATATGAEGGPNLDYLDATPPDGQAATDHEAEDGTVSQGAVESNHTGYSGRGFVNFQVVTGAFVEFTVETSQPAHAKLDFRYALGATAARSLDISVNGDTVADDLSFPPTGAWTTWRTVSAQATLQAGQNKIRATTSSGDGPNLDKLTVTPTGPADSERPTAPGNLRKDQEPTASTVSLAWEAATDNVKVVAYDIYQHGQHMKEVDGNTLAATVTGLDPETSYDWTVFARDAAGNVSVASNQVTIATLPAPPDTEPPTAPSGLRSTGRTATSVDLAWTASTDNVRVTGYEIFRDGAPAETADATTGTVAGLTANTAYTFTVRAFDLKGNRSAFSPEITVTTGGSQPGGVPDPGPVSTITSGVDVPWGLAFLPDGSGVFTERNSFNVYRLTKSGQKTLLGKVPNSQTTSGEGGLMGVEVGPGFAADRYLYFLHTSSEGNRVARMKLETNNTLSGYTVLLRGMDKSKFHNGGRLRFGPDGKLYASMGDAQGPSKAQDRNSLNGKILRINPDGSIPSDNPFGNAVWSMGHRNPQGIDFDSKGRLWQAEFGDGTMDEVNLIQKGGNYGWPSCEGTNGSCSGYLAPKKTWPTSAGSPSGLTIINDHVFVATTRGERVYRMRIDSGSNLVEQKTYFQGTYDRLRTVEVDQDGDIWLTTSSDKDGTGNNDRVLLIDIVYSGGPPTPGEFKLSSSAFNDNGTIPSRYTCAGDGSPGQDPSPPLAWGAGTAGARGYAVVFADVANNGNKLHWAIWDIPAAKLTLPEGLGTGFTVPGQDGAKQKAMGSGANAQKYFGPCPGGSTHPYTFTLYALNTATVPGIGSGSSMAQIETAIKGASTANARLRGNSNAAA
ncbi:PQQ-dependent sugar dehydrogenase [Streptomyces clavuligerus]|uniref:Glucose/sorbosone dehydrogenase n=2 Tax=Streptomyces clavuligerus TaxID=1901 RepID=E2Q9R2_STRCL|nr:PQQ-dependent sugar dehydrogenase [Streptomyces clavuligerus]ANW19551.1 carbohydrate-binding protein [Streptomyces clavuligerus]AXU14158.1 carbohydrate-binding protein [Streptomyces clavuligerus]EFG07639.1 Glucose/sorbosone dehydrogenase [Streptomyces clavuligerus]MBY6304152.1 PQQ-dependent sugar dehydrogenase [Streptomyces clavuligerus]QCS06931.1 carbohydrate-binding protein [Streptomyces clavuligerus]